MLAQVALLIVWGQIKLYITSLEMVALIIDIEPGSDYHAKSYHAVGIDRDQSCRDKL